MTVFRKQIINPTTRILLLFALVTITLLSFNACRQPEFPDIQTDTWYISDDGSLALKFLSTQEPIVGVYMICDRAVAEVNTFDAEWDDNDLGFNFHENPSLKLEGLMSATKDEFVINCEDDKEIVFRTQNKEPFPSPPYRYSSVVFDSVVTKELVYGHAPGFYASKSTEESEGSSYSEIFLDITGSISKNLGTKDIPLSMDVYTPYGDTVKNRPLILLIHGGAFVAGDKREQLVSNLASYYTRCGFVVASINYRMGYVFLPGMYTNLERCMYKALQDVKASLRFLSQHHKKFGIDPEMIFVGGNSAGGFLSLLTAFMTDDEAWTSRKGKAIQRQEDLGSINNSTNQAKGAYRLKGVISMWGAIEDLSIIDVDENIPTLLIHGNDDRIVPCGYDYPFKDFNKELTSFFVKKNYGSDYIKKHLDSLGIPSNYHCLNGEGHEPYATDSNSLNLVYYQIRQNILDFMNTQLINDTLHIHGPIEISANDKVCEYIVPESADITMLWDCKGGVITKVSSNKAKVVWFADNSNREIKVALIGKQGQIKSIKLKIGNQN